MASPSSTSSAVEVPSSLTAASSTSSAMEVPSSLTAASTSSVMAPVTSSASRSQLSSAFSPASSSGSSSTSIAAGSAPMAITLTPVKAVSALVDRPPPKPWDFSEFDSYGIHGSESESDTISTSTTSGVSSAGFTILPGISNRQYTRGYSSNGRRELVKYMSGDYLKGFEKLEERRRALSQRAHDLHKESSEIVEKLMSRLVIFLFAAAGGALVGKGGLVVGLTCKDSLVIACQVVVLVLVGFGFVYGTALWRIKSMRIYEENLGGDFVNFGKEVDNYLSGPDKRARRSDNKIRASWPSDWDDRCNRVKEKLENKYSIEYHTRCIHLVAGIFFVVGVIAIFLICGIHCFGTSAPPPPPFSPLHPPSPPTSSTPSPLLLHMLTPPPLNTQQSPPPLMASVPIWFCFALAVVAVIAF